MAEINIEELREAYEDLSREVAREAANRWFSASQEALLQGGDERGYDVAPVAQAAQPPQWDPSEGGYTFVYPHVASEFFEYGTAPHEIEGDPVLAFEWPEAPPEIQEMFEETFPTVFLPEVEVEGIEALRYIERGRQQAEQWLEEQ